MIFQDPLSSLDPIFKIGDQIIESIMAHQKLEKSKARAKANELMQLVGIPDADFRFEQYPFQLSGGMRQRVMIAMALSSNPTMLIADEPTTNLDVTIQAQIIELLRKIRDETGMAILLITHNLGLVAWICDRVSVMYAGKIVEQASFNEIPKKLKHPYTRSLYQAVPIFGQSKQPLDTIHGDVPNLIQMPSGCSFHPRCPVAKEICADKEPSLSEVDPNHNARCLIYETKLWD